jgi:pimeloyl-ACP methyl ester carboxylesterase
MLSHDRTGTGEPLVLIHPLGGTRIVWEPVTPLLAASRDVIAPDLPGFGQSPALAPDQTPTAARLARAVADFLDVLGIDMAHVAGNSLGGWVALELERLGRARSVTAVAPAGLWSRPLGPRPGKSLRPLGTALAPFAPLLLSNRRIRALALSGAFAHPERVPAHAARALVSAYLRAPAYEEANRQMRAGVFTLRRSDVPVTLVWPELDRLVARPRQLPAWVSSIDLPGCGHVPMWDDPPLVADVILAGTGAATRGACRSGRPPTRGRR